MANNDDGRPGWKGAKPRPELDQLADGVTYLCNKLARGVSGGVAERPRSSRPDARPGCAAHGCARYRTSGTGLQRAGCHARPYGCTRPRQRTPPSPLSGRSPDRSPAPNPQPPRRLRPPEAPAEATPRGGRGVRGDPRLSHAPQEAPKAGTPARARLRHRRGRGPQGDMHSACGWVSFVDMDRGRERRRG